MAKKKKGGAQKPVIAADDKVEEVEETEELEETAEAGEPGIAT